MTGTASGAKIFPALSNTKNTVARHKVGSGGCCGPRKPCTGNQAVTVVFQIEGRAMRHTSLSFSAPRPGQQSIGEATDILRSDRTSTKLTARHLDHDFANAAKPLRPACRASASASQQEFPAKSLFHH